MSSPVLVLVGPHLPDPGQLCHVPELLQFPHLNPGSQQGDIPWEDGMGLLPSPAHRKPQCTLAVNIVVQPPDIFGHISPGDGGKGAASLFFRVHWGLYPCLGCHSLFANRQHWTPSPK